TLEVPGLAPGREDARGRPLPLAPGQERVADPAQGSCRQVHVAHEALDGLSFRAGAVAQLAGEARLQLEGEPVLLAARREVSRMADADQEVAGCAGLPHVLTGENPALEDLAEGPDVEAHLGDPERRFEVSQPALPVLHVGLEQEDGVPELLSPGTELVDLGLDEGVGVVRPLIRNDRALRSRPEPAVAGDAPRVE